MPKHEITLREALDAGTIRVGDGAMGTSLQDAGLDDGGAPELWNVEKADAVAGFCANTPRRAPTYSPPTRSAVQHHDCSCTDSRIDLMNSILRQPS